MLYQFVQKRAAIISLCTFAGTCDSICLKWTSFKYLNNSFVVMVIALLWMVVEFENATSEVQQTKESEIWSRLSIALHILLPVAGLAIFLKQKHILSRLLLQLDRKCVSVYCPSFSKRERLLRWAGSRLPQTWSSQSRTLSGGISELWTDGSLLCTLINSAIPGACLNPHRHWKKPPLHAQALAYKYLGVIPIFTEKELLGELTVTLERNFLQYLDEIQQAVLKLTERNDLNKTTSALYIARGMGLYTGEQHRKTVFYIYPNTPPTICNNTNIIIHIRGPYGTYGKAIIPKFHNELFTTPGITLSSEILLTKNLLQNSASKKGNPFIKNFSLPFMHYHKKHLGDNIVIHITMEDDRAKVTYIPKNYGMYEIVMISNGELIRGCPYNVHILNNTSGIQETLESEEKEEEIPHTRKRKVISKTIDFIDEQMPMADVKKRYKINMENKFNNSAKTAVENNTAVVNTKTAKIENKSSLEVIDENKASDETLILQPKEKKGPLETQENKSIIEEEDEPKILCREENVKNDEIDIGMATNDPSNILEKQNVESVNEGNSCKLLVTPDLPNLDSDSNEIEAMHSETSNIFTPSTKETIKNTINNILTKTTNLAAKEFRPSDDEDSLEERIIPERKKTMTDPVEGILTFNEYPKPITVNKIHIPEKFTVFQNIYGENSTDDLNTKHLKNVINSSSKRDIPRHLMRSAILQEDDVKRIAKKVQNYPMLEPKAMLNQNDDNDSGHDTISSLEDNEVRQNLVRAISREKSPGDTEKLNAIPRRFFHVQESPKESVRFSPPLVRQNSTSPICPDPIVPEVNHEFRLISVAERRKIFANSQSNNTSPISRERNIEPRKAPRHFQQYEGLSVLNFLGSLKETENARKSNSLYSTKSLPNMPLVEDDYVFRNSVKDRKQFWEKLSTSTVSLNANLEVPRKKIKEMTEEERLRLIWKKPNETEIPNNTILEDVEMPDMEKDSEMSKSADDILTISNCVPYQDPKKYKSFDDSLDNCTVISIEERKKMLLQQNYEREKTNKTAYNTVRKNSSRIKSSHNVKDEAKFEGKNNDLVVFSPIMEKIKKYDSACNLTAEPEENIKTTSNPEKKKVSETHTHNHSNMEDAPKQEKVKLRSHFKKAIRYFKDLEEKSLGKSKSKLKGIDSRRYSLDLIHTGHHKNKRKGGSLNIPSVSERFSINSLYEDVFGSQKGSFKGAPNRSGLVEALATFSRKENSSFTEDSEENITYDIFKKRAKSKKRKSIRSIFDVYY